VALEPVRSGQLVVGAVELRIISRGQLPLRDRVIGAPFLVVIRGKAEMGDGPVGLELQRLLVFFNGLVPSLVIVRVYGDAEMLLWRLRVGDLELLGRRLGLNEALRMSCVRDALCFLLFLLPAL